VISGKNISFREIKLGMNIVVQWVIFAPGRFYQEKHEGAE
jgi:hypothetical protein